MLKNCLNSFFVLGNWPYATTMVGDQRHCSIVVDLDDLDIKMFRIYIIDIITDPILKRKQTSHRIHE